MYLPCGMMFRGTHELLDESFLQSSWVRIDLWAHRCDQGFSGGRTVDHIIMSPVCIEYRLLLDMMS
jgi:hypothetical protein